MKKLSFACLLASLFFGLHLAAQPCEYFALIVIPSPGNPCNFDVSVVRTDSVVGTFDEIVLTASDTNSFFTEAIAADTVVIANLSGDFREAVFTTPYNLASLPLNVAVPIGTLTTTSPLGEVAFGGSIRGLGGTVCTFGGFGGPVTCLLPPPVSTFYKKYGDAEENYPTKIKGFNGFTYLLAARKTATSTFTTFSKFTNAGVLVWERQVDTSCLLLDFEWTGPVDNSFLLVGRLEPIQVGGVNQDNCALMVKINNAGVTQFVKAYCHTGRESFTRIIRHSRAVPANPPTPYQFYVLGHKNLTLPANGTDQPMLYNVDNQGNWRFKQEYNYAFELEGHYGMFQRTGGNVVILGTSAPNNEGVLIEINGVTGAVVSAQKYNNANNTDKYDFHDGLEIPGGNVVIAGEDFVNNQGILLRLNGSTYAPVVANRFSNVNSYKEIGLAPLSNTAGAILYVVGQEKTAPAVPDFPVISRISSTSGAFSTIYSAYFDECETDLQHPRFSVTPNVYRIFYADSRLEAGNWNMMVSTLQLHIAIENPPHNCRVPFTNTPSALSPVRTGITVTTAVLANMVSDLSNVSPFPMPCFPFCPMPTCTASFTWTIDNCRKVSLNGIGSSNACPGSTLNFSWTTTAPGVSIPAVQNPMVTFPAGTFQVCLTVSVPGYCTVTHCQNITVPAASPPTCVAPPNILVNTNPGFCYAALSPQITGTGCPTLSISATANNGVGPWGPGGNPLSLPANYPKGVTTVNATVTDGLNQTATCSFTVTVIDAQPPTIVCPQNINVNVPACDGGAFVNYSAPTVTDNCPMPTHACTPPSGSFFPCGTTTVSCTATDMSQNVSQPCTFTVNVNCLCATTGTPTITCDPVVDDKYLFSIPVTILNGSTNCTVDVAGGTNPASVTVMSNGPVSVTTGSGVITGMITVTGGVIPPLFNLVVSVNCTCPGGQMTSCNLPVSIVPICCRKITLTDQSICATAQTTTMSLGGCSQFQCIERVDWYVATGPVCPPYPGTGWSLQQSGTTCAPMTLLPYLYTDNIWVVAVMDVCDFPCNIVQSNIACITLCQPVSCNITSAIPQDFCYTGSPITPHLMTVNYSNGTACPPASVSWTGPPGTATGNTFQPAPVSASSVPLPCWEDFTYTAHVQTICGTQTCSATVRLYKDNADIGDLVMDPDESQPPTFPPYCPGEDFTLRFTEECSDDDPPAPGLWTWCISTTGPASGFTLIPGSGTMNPLWNTNQLYADTWYKVIGQNGVCPPKEEVYMIDIRPAFSIGAFTATPVLNGSCQTTAVNLAIPFTPTPADPNCQIKVTWVKNGQVLHMAFYTSSPATWQYVDPALLGDYSGNYWAIVERICCNEKLTSNLVPVGGPCLVGIAAPCFRCNNQPVTLCGVLVNVPNGVICTYQWYANGTPIPAILGGNQLCITVYQANVTYTFTANCNGCIKSESYFLKQCGGGPYVNVFYKDFDIDEFGNPDSSLTNLGQPPGYVIDNTDCNDQNAAIHPGAPEICNNLDDDCNGNPEAATTNWTGNGDNLNWSDPANWSDGIVPLQCQHVVLPSGKIVKVAAGFNAVGKTLTVPTTTQLTVDPTGTMIIQN